MAERSTSRSADGAARHHDDPASVIDSWISRQSWLEAGDSDSSYERQEAAVPWRDGVSDQDGEAYEPAEAYQEHEGQHARHRTQPQYEDEAEQYDGAYAQHEHEYPSFDSPVDPEPAYYQPDQTYMYDAHDQAYREERRAQDRYGPGDASSVHEDAYGAQQERYAQSEAGYAHEEYPHDDYASRNQYRHEEPGARNPEAPELRPRTKHNRDVDARPRPASRRRRWLIPVGVLALGALVCALAFMWGSGRPPEDGLPLSAATTPPYPSEQPDPLLEIPSTPPDSAAPRNASTTPSATPSETRSATPSATPSVTPSTPKPTVATPTPTQNAGPVLLGPSSSRGVANMVQRYCDRHTGGSADSRNDGRWQCTRLLSASIVDMDVACRDTYESGAYARTSNPDDPYAWRCYR
ncbi:hypothetical protein OG470_06020 [Micromonospora sp. NBC_00389]|uniref:hypothetical protein n=1 Tax=Micromonospora sp. NBC_00389 TaxID=2903586 RepID=UPI002E1CDF18